MKLFQLFGAVALRRDYRSMMITALLCLSVSSLVSRDLRAQPIKPIRLEVGLTPTLQVIPEALAGNHVWAGGFTATATYRFHTMVAVEGAMLGAFAPQLNYKSSSTLNSINTSVAAELHQMSVHAWDPYVSLGVGHASFRYIDPPEGFDRSREYMYTRAAVGVRYALSHRVNWRAEMLRQFSSVGSSNTFMSGVSLRIREKVSK